MKLGTMILEIGNDSNETRIDFCEMQINFSCKMAITIYNKNMGNIVMSI
ncbi:MAG: hypothetical protein HUJ61_07785 [Bacilli bacterium]|nr:hypothetical protein [Bacilli bacterium]